AGVLGQREGVAAGAEQVGVAGAPEPHDRTVGLAEHDGAGPLDPLRERTRDVRGELLGRPHTTAGRRPTRREVEQVLDRGGHPVQHPKLRPRHHRPLRLASPLAGVIKAEKDKGIQALVSGLDTLDKGIHDLNRGQLTAPDPGRQLRRRRGGKLIPQRHPDTSPPPPLTPPPTPPVLLPGSGNGTLTPSCPGAPGPSREPRRWPSRSPSRRRRSGRRAAAPASWVRAPAGRPPKPAL